LGSFASRWMRVAGVVHSMPPPAMHSTASRTVNDPGPCVAGPRTLIFLKTAQRSADIIQALENDAIHRRAPNSCATAPQDRPARQ
jgi:hypothetical protein